MTVHTLQNLISEAFQFIYSLGSTNQKPHYVEQICHVLSLHLGKHVGRGRARDATAVTLDNMTNLKYVHQGAPLAHLTDWHPGTENLRGRNILPSFPYIHSRLLSRYFFVYQNTVFTNQVGLVYSHGFSRGVILVEFWFYHSTGEADSNFCYVEECPLRLSRRDFVKNSTPV